MAMKIQIGDTVLVRKGADKGNSGKVLKFSPDRTRVLVEGINIRTLHKKAGPSGQEAGLFKEAKMISISNVGIAHPTKKKITSRVGFEVTKDGAKKRILKANGKEIK